MTYVSERELVANVLDGFTAGVPILWPDTEQKPPATGGDPTSPVSYLIADVEYDNQVLADFGGGSRVDGRVVVYAWVERNAGDDLLRQRVDALRTLFAAGDDSSQGCYFFEPRVGPPQVGGSGGEWYGRRVDCPFLRTT